MFLGGSASQFTIRCMDCPSRAMSSTSLANGSNTLPFGPGFGLPAEIDPAVAGRAGMLSDTLRLPVQPAGLAIRTRRRS